ncbi:hypothetical protein SAMN04487761_1203 [Lachnospiraceae bacterium C7]|nr:hypothetical protein SAMN04487761_1203 [Lachnospiraceae bacterium C7]
MYKVLVKMAKSKSSTYILAGVILILMTIIIIGLERNGIRAVDGKRINFQLNKNEVSCTFSESQNDTVKEQVCEYLINDTSSSIDAADIATLSSSERATLLKITMTIDPVDDEHAQVVFEHAIGNKVNYTRGQAFCITLKAEYYGDTYDSANNKWVPDSSPKHTDYIKEVPTGLSVEIQLPPGQENMATYYICRETGELDSTGKVDTIDLTACTYDKIEKYHKLKNADEYFKIESNKLDLVFKKMGNHVVAFNNLYSDDTGLVNVTISDDSKVLIDEMALTYLRKNWAQLYIDKLTAEQVDKLNKKLHPGDPAELVVQSNISLISDETEKQGIVNGTLNNSDYTAGYGVEIYFDLYYKELGEATPTNQVIEIGRISEFEQPVVFSIELPMSERGLSGYMVCEEHEENSLKTYRKIKEKVGNPSEYFELDDTRSVITISTAYFSKFVIANTGSSASEDESKITVNDIMGTANSTVKLTDTGKANLPRLAKASILEDIDAGTIDNLTKTEISKVGNSDNDSTIDIDVTINEITETTAKEVFEGAKGDPEEYKLGTGYDITIKANYKQDGVLTDDIDVKTADVTHTSSRIQFEIELPKDDQGHKNYAIYRKHKEGDKETYDALSPTVADGEDYFLVSSDKKTITIYASKFSEYVVAYNDGDESTEETETGETETGNSENNNSENNNSETQQSDTGSTATASDGTGSNGGSGTDDGSSTNNNTNSNGSTASGGTATATANAAPGGVAGGSATRIIGAGGKASRIYAPITGDPVLDATLMVLLLVASALEIVLYRLKKQIKEEIWS